MLFCLTHQILLSSAWLRLTGYVQLCCLCMLGHVCGLEGSDNSGAFCAAILAHVLLYLRRARMSLRCWNCCIVNVTSGQAPFLRNGEGESSEVVQGNGQVDDCRRRWLANCSNFLRPRKTSCSVAAFLTRQPKQPQALDLGKMILTPLDMSCNNCDSCSSR